MRILYIQHFLTGSGEHLDLNSYFNFALVTTNLLYIHSHSLSKYQRAAAVSEVSDVVSPLSQSVCM